ncbi:MAG: hypothetical protein Kow0068_16910 [Marinilabiliales bacterium]
MSNNNSEPNKHFLKYIQLFKESLFFKKNLISIFCHSFRFESNEIDNSIFQKIYNNINQEFLLVVKPERIFSELLDFIVMNYHDNDNNLKPLDTESLIITPEIHLIDDILNINTEKDCSYIVKNQGIIVASDSLESAFIKASVVAFSAFISFFYNYLNDFNKHNISDIQQNIFNKITSYYKNHLNKISANIFNLTESLKTEAEILHSIINTGKIMVNTKMVDSVFGNVSYRHNNSLYITTTGSYLNKLENSVIKAPLQGSCDKASSELPAHQAVLKDCNSCGIIHGHPRFSVIMSLLCEKANCENKGNCHVLCKEKRYINDIPIVSGISGGGKNSIAETLPLAMKESDTVIVLGHGVFVKSSNGLSYGVKKLLETEKTCFNNYLKLFQK